MFILEQCISPTSQELGLVMADNTFHLVVIKFVSSIVLALEQFVDNKVHGRLKINPELSSIIAQALTIQSIADACCVSYGKLIVAKRVTHSVNYYMLILS